MTDRRFFPGNARVVLAGMPGAPEGVAEVAGTPASIVVPVADLRGAPGGKRDRQLLFGDRFLVLEEGEDWVFGQAAKDGYVGYLAADAVGEAVEATHFVGVRSTHAYTVPSVKAPDVRALSFGSSVRVIAEERAYVELVDGTFVPKPHLRPVGQTFRDMVTVAQVFFGTPYLWGGNSAWGIDCSGLVQIAAMAAGVECPPDSDLQAARFGDEIAMDAPVVRGDLYFWKGHVAIAVDEATLIHANAHHMAVAYEPLAAALARIEAQEGVGVTMRRRL
ncbi:MAG: NlpC/P60 family protein [Pseudomonadota bacterium]